METIDKLLALYREEKAIKARIKELRSEHSRLLQEYAQTSAGEMIGSEKQGPRSYGRGGTATLRAYSVWGSFGVHEEWRANNQPMYAHLQVYVKRAPVKANGELWEARNRSEVVEEKYFDLDGNLITRDTAWQRTENAIAAMKEEQAARSAVDSA